MGFPSDFKLLASLGMTMSFFGSLVSSRGQPTLANGRRSAPFESNWTIRGSADNPAVHELGLFHCERRLAARQPPHVIVIPFGLHHAFRCVRRRGQEHMTRLMRDCER